MLIHAVVRTYGGLDVDLLQLRRNRQGVLWRAILLQKHSEGTGETLETEQVVTVRRDLDLELRRRSRQALCASFEDIFGSLDLSVTVNMEPRMGERLTSSSSSIP
jgi:hypothetical protein